MTKRSIVSGLVAAGVIALSGGAMAAGTTSGDSQPQANGTSGQEECKAVTVYSTREQMRNQNKPGVPGSDIQKAEGAQQIGRVAGFPPAGVRDDKVAKSGNIAGKVMTHC